MLRKLLGGTCIAAVFALLAGCGGSSATSTAGGSQTGTGGTTVTVQGIATPSSVAVVTANNSN